MAGSTEASGPVASGPAVVVQLGQRPHPPWGMTWTVVVHGLASSVRVTVAGVGWAGPVGSPAAQVEVGAAHAMRQTGRMAVWVVVVGPLQPHWGRAEALEGGKGGECGLVGW